jgi:histidine ammonia-lyase
MILVDGKSLTSADIHAISCGSPISLCLEALGRMEENSHQVPDGSMVLESKRRWLLGNTGSQLPSDLVRTFILGHCAGVGEPLPDGIVRGAMAARANVLASGCTGSRPAAAEVLAKMLNKGIHPRVPSQGSVGAAGDLAPMAHIARVACGYSGTDLGFPPLRPTAKEALALINGVSLSSAIAAIALCRSKRVFQAAQLSAAMTMEAIQAQSQCLDPRALKLRGHPDAERVGSRLRHLLEGSARVSQERRPDAFSIRCGPSVMGAVLRTVDFAEVEVDRELNSASDNPLLLDGEWIEAGNFHGASIGMAMDHLKTALAQLATLSERRTFRLTHGKLSKDLPSFLVQGSGLNSGFMLAQYTAAALASETKGLAHPASADSIPTVQHHEDHVSMAPIAGRMALQSVECVADIVAIELLLGAQALDLRRMEDGKSLPPKLAALHGRIREKVDFWEDDGVLHPAIAACSQMVRSGELLELLETG